MRLSAKLSLTLAILHTLRLDANEGKRLQLLFVVKSILYRNVACTGLLSLMRYFLIRGFDVYAFIPIDYISSEYPHVEHAEILVVCHDNRFDSY
jgi:hypothetical protein